MMDETLRIEVRRLWEVECLTMRQIASKLRLGRKTVRRILRGETAKKFPKPSIIAPYERLVAEWYKASPALCIFWPNLATRTYNESPASLRSDGWPFWTRIAGRISQNTHSGQSNSFWTSPPGSRSYNAPMP